MIVRKAVGWFGVSVIVAIIGAAFMAYFIFSFDPLTKTTYDGLGRQLYESPWFMRFFFGQDRQWAGWLWFVGDLIIFLGGMAFGINLAKWGFKDRAS